MTVGIAAWVGHIAFWALLVYGYVVEELTPRGVAVILVLWALGQLGGRYAPLGWPSGLSAAVEPVLAVALVFIVVRRDVRIL